VVHPGYGNYKGTLVNALVYHFQQLPVNKSAATLEVSAKSKEQALLRPGLVHRLDKNTSGIMVVAKSEIAMMKLAKDFFDRNLDRKYQALVWGDFKEDEGTVTGNIGRHLKDRKLMDVFPPDSEHGKHAITHYKVLERFGYVTLIECKLETGRTHQIRAHMQHIGHSLFNDDTYGGDRILKGTTFAKYKQFVDNCFTLLPRQALHAKSLGFNHPVSGKYIHFDSELPDDMQAVINKWRGYAVSMALEE
jgi:23S rRNA pseudouridine1911/1915/1917 synthase